MMKALAFAALVAATDAACPNSCSGHGICGSSTKCDCYRNWFGADCSERICTFGLAFVDTPVGDLDGDGDVTPSRAFDPRDNNQVVGVNNVIGGRSELYSSNYGYARASRVTPWNEAHFYRECSNKGLCDRATGLCNCFPGYEGEGCTRTVCPNDCSGRGRCRLIADVDAEKTYSAWDRSKGAMCVCDAGYEGPDCSLRSCPSGADPVQNALVVTDTVQGIIFRTIQGSIKKVYFTITMEDEFGDEWTSKLLTVNYEPKGSYSYPLTETAADLAALVESVNNSISYNPNIEGHYTWGFGVVASKANVHKGAPGKVYPSSEVGYGNLTSPFVDSIDYRLDLSIKNVSSLQSNTGAICGGGGAAAGKSNLSATCLFIRNSNPGYQKPYRVSYFFNPWTKASGGNKLATVSGRTMGWAHTSSSTSKTHIPNEGYAALVSVVDAQGDRKWNKDDGDVTKLFIQATNNGEQTVDVCSQRGTCDYATGLCNCFSGYSGLRCNEQNAIAYSY